MSNQDDGHRDLKLKKLRSEKKDLEYFIARSQEQLDRVIEELRKEEQQ